MTSELRKLGKHTLIYAVGIAISKLASFLMLPIYTRFLTPSDYGVLELLSMTIEVVGTLASLGLAMAVFKFYAEQETTDRKRLVVSTSELALLVLAGVSAAGGILAAPVLDRLILGEAGRPLYFQLFFLIYFFQTAENVPLLYLRALNKSVFFVVVSVAKLLLMLSLNIWLVVFEGMDVLGVLIGNLTATALTASYLTVYVFRETGVRFSFPLARTMAAFSAPLVFWALGNFVLVFSDRYFLKHYADTAAVGIYSLAYRFAAILTAFGFRPFFMIWGPQRFEVAQQDDAQEIFPRVFTYMNTTLGAVALLIVLFSDEVIRVMADPSFHPSAGVVPILIVGQILYHWVAFSNLGMYVNDRTGRLGMLSSIAAVLVVGLNVWLIPRYGVYGAAWATLIAYGFRYVIVLIASQREYHIEHSWRRVGLLYVFLIAAFAGHQWLGDPGLVLSTAGSAGLAVAALAGIYLTVLDSDERRTVRSLIRKPGRVLRNLGKKESPAGTG